MYPRLLLAKDLLKDEGVIFISIDDNEVAQLKLLCDEVFGQQNFINQISVKAKGSSGASGGGEDKKIKKNIEHLICYAKSNAFIKFNGIYEEKLLSNYINERNLNGKSFAYTKVLVHEGVERFEKNIEAGNGDLIEVYTVEDHEVKSVSALSKEENTSVGKIYEKYYDKIFTTENAQTSIRDRVKDALPHYKGLINIYYTPVSGRNKGARTKVSFEGSTKRLVSYLSNVSEIKAGKIIKKDIIGTLWSDLSWSSVSKEGNVPYPNGKKPILLIKRMVKMISSESKDDIIMDFFAGSGSTAHAVMDINANDGGLRKSISIQIDEPILPKDKEKYYSDDNFKSIFEITQKRINNAGEQIAKGDIGFRTFEIIEDAKQHIYQTPLEKATQGDMLELLESSTIDSNEDILYNLLVAEALPLSSTIETLVADKLYLASNVAFVLGDISIDTLIETLKDKKALEYITVYSPNISDDKFTLELESAVGSIGIKTDKLRFRG